MLLHACERSPRGVSEALEQAFSGAGRGSMSMGESDQAEPHVGSSTWPAVVLATEAVLSLKHRCELEFHDSFQQQLQHFRGESIYEFSRGHFPPFLSPT